MKTSTHDDDTFHSSDDAFARLSNTPPSIIHQSGFFFCLSAQAGVSIVVAASLTSKLMVQNLLQLSMHFFMHVPEIEHTSLATLGRRVQWQRDNYLHTMVDIVFPLHDIIYHYTDYLPLEIIILYRNRCLFTTWSVQHIKSVFAINTHWSE